MQPWDPAQSSSPQGPVQVAAAPDPTLSLATHTPALEGRAGRGEPVPAPVEPSVAQCRWPVLAFTSRGSRGPAQPQPAPVCGPQRSRGRPVPRRLPAAPPLPGSPRAQPAAPHTAVAVAWAQGAGAAFCVKSPRWSARVPRVGPVVTPRVLGRSGGFAASGRSLAVGAVRGTTPVPGKRRTGRPGPGWLPVHRPGLTLPSALAVDPRGTWWPLAHTRASCRSGMPLRGRSCPCWKATRRAWVRSPGPLPSPLGPGFLARLRPTLPSARLQGPWPGMLTSCPPGAGTA